MIAKEKDKQVVLGLRNKGLSYSQIRNKVNVSKSTLSLWLKDFPLSKERIDSLRGKNPARIERFRNTMRTKKEIEEKKSFDNVTDKIGKLSEREIILAGLFLYWGEGTKAAPSTVAMTNTDPDILRLFIKWLHVMNVKSSKLKVVLHLYSDMNIGKEMQFWSNYLRIPVTQFRRPYIKKSRFSELSYKNGFGHGTCSVLYLDMELYRYIMAGLKYIRKHA